jgi:hypothetical protein
VNGKHIFLIVYVFFNFLFMHCSSLPLEKRVEAYLSLVFSGEDIPFNKEASLARSIALVKVALGLKEGEDFCPDEEAVLYWLRNSYLNPHSVDPHTGATLLHFAAYYSACEVLRFLLCEAGVSAESVDKEGQTALHWAVSPYCGIPQQDVVELLLQAKKNLVHARNYSQRTPFLCVSSYSDVSDLLVSAGAQVNATDNKERTALFNFKSAKETRYLCSRGVSVNHPDSQRLTALGSYLAHYSLRWETLKNHRYSDEPTLAEMEAGIQVLIQYGGYIPRLYHPAYRLKVPSGSEKRYKQYVLEKVLRRFLMNLEEGIEWIKTRAALTARDKKMKGVDPLEIFEKYVSLIPFFCARYQEAQEIMGKEKEIGFISKEEDISTPAAFHKFLCRLSFSRYISPQLLAIAYDAVGNQEKYSTASSLSDEEKSEKGKALLQWLTPSYYPNDDAA